ncbi:hypothetical protein L5515_005951 [Caenorhabditis briggsae]|uniref:Uncharacterized protein n=1 Tax=Caenorhabditis briggsae TaxID=6238 RepID=A0AAE9EZI8_CAEBR|nr:hypothetical protein L5515_005951 [Caenorhabditis briggsae]
MPSRTFATLGFLIFVVFILLVVGIFTPNWLISTDLRNGVSIPIGMVPYPSQLTSMFPTLCILMYIALGLSMVSLLCFMVAFLLVRKDDYSGKVRFLLHLIAGSSLLIVLLVVVTIALAGSNLALNVALGYSVWFCVASAIISAANALISEYIVGKKFD